AARARRGAAREERGFEVELALELGDERPELGGVERRLLLGREGGGAQDSVEAPASAFDRRLP
ncbi:MAG TPA: hypothetical protein VD926_04300, partial [Acidimicrobiales bacterium]|nr:hypothetical protein [Acidimicrobiales bacterium]